MDTKLNLFCFNCESKLNFESSQSSLEISHKFQIYTKKFLNSVSVEENKLESEPGGSQSVSYSGDDDQSRNEKISCCDKCAREVEAFCEMWASFESLQTEMIWAVVNITNLTKNKNKLQQQSEVSEQPHCFICQKSNVSGPISEIETCLKFRTFVTRFVSNTEKPCFDQKALDIFTEMGKIRNLISVYCCDNCLTEIVTFCEMYEALDSLRLEILRILDRISNNSRRKHFRSSVENRRKLSFPRVQLERLPCLEGKPDHIEDKTEIKTLADFGSNPKSENQPAIDDDDFDNIEMSSHDGTPTPTPSSVQDNNNDDKADSTETVPAQTANIFQSLTHVTMKTPGPESEKTKRNPSRKRNRQSASCNYKGACVFCGKKYTFPNQLGNHLRSHTCERSFICRICLQEYSYKQNLLIHRRRHHHKDDNTTDGRHSCDICAKTFSTRSNMLSHKEIVHGGFKRICHLCGKNLCKNRSLTRHLNEHHRSEIDDSLKLEKKFKCSFADCPRAFYDRRDFDRHLLTHTREKKFQCDECGKSFTLEFQLKRHQECHKEVRPHVCKHCGKGFNYRFRLIGHVKKYHNSEEVT